MPHRTLDEQVTFRDAGHGYDLFGLNPRVLDRLLGPTRFFYRHYFRVASHDADNIPARGPAILAANHSGPLPIDAMMLFADVIEQTDPPRIPRPVMDLFVLRLPLIGTMFARAGGVSGTRRNCRRLLEDGELLLVFPEGTPGVAKTVWHRYELQPWRVGHVELAIRYRAPVVPVAILGGEEMWPLVGRLDRLHPFGAPYLPIPALPLPMPVKFHIYYGAPMQLADDYPAARADDPAVLADASRRVADRVRQLIQRGRDERGGLFR